MKGKGTKSKDHPGSSGLSPAKKKPLILVDEADMESDDDDVKLQGATASGVSAGAAASTVAGAAAQLPPGDTDRPPAWFAAFEARQEARFDTLLKECNDCREEHAGLKLEFDNLKDSVTKLTSTLREAELKIDELENRSRRNNVVIYNVPEGSEPGADCVKFVSNLLAECKLTATIQRAHRTGAKPPTDSTSTNNLRPRSRPRPIHIAFSNYIEKETCRKGLASHFKDHTYGDNTKYFVSDDYTRRVLQMRKEKLPELFKLRKEGKYAYMVYPATIRVRESRQP